MFSLLSSQYAQSFFVLMLLLPTKKTLCFGKARIDEFLIVNMWQEMEPAYRNNI